MADETHWHKKMRVYFTRIDFDHDGTITLADFKGMAKRFIEHGKLDATRSKDLEATLIAVWEKYLSTVGGGEACTQEVFIQSMGKLVDDPSLKSTLEGPLPLFFHAVDANNDGLISKEEYAEFFRILGLKDGLADEAFVAIDTDKDGQLSEKEFITAGSDFFLNKTKGHPSDIFWGPLE